MFLTGLICLPLLGLLVGAAVDDFADIRGQFTFFYHEKHIDDLTPSVAKLAADKAGLLNGAIKNLLLSIKSNPDEGGDKCYFVNVDPKGTDVLHVTCHRENIERDVEQAIQEGGHDTQRTLEYVRNIYSDLLADFHCMDKDVFTLDFDFSSYVAICSDDNTELIGK